MKYVIVCFTTAQHVVSYNLVLEDVSHMEGKTKNHLPKNIFMFPWSGNNQDANLKAGLEFLQPTIKNGT